MDYENAKKILSEIESHGMKGCGVLSISRSTNIDKFAIREFLKNNPDMVCKSSSKPTYTLNRYGKYKGSLDKMLNSIEKTAKINHLFWYVLVAVIAFNLGLALGNVN